MAIISLHQGIGVSLCVALSMVSGAPRAAILTSQIQCILWQNIFCKFQLWYSLHFQIFEFDTNIIQILVWIIGSIYIQRRRYFAAKLECQQAIFSLLPEIHMVLGVQKRSRTTECLNAMYMYVAYMYVVKLGWTFHQRGYVYYIVTKWIEIYKQQRKAI